MVSLQRSDDYWPSDRAYCATSCSAVGTDPGTGKGVEPSEYLTCGPRQGFSSLQMKAPL